MISDKDIQNKGTSSKKKRYISLKIILFLVLVLTIVLSVFYIYYKSTQAKIAEYDSNIKQIESLQKEKERCSNVLGQGSGNFGDYEYCRQLLQAFPK